MALSGVYKAGELVHNGGPDHWWQTLTKLLLLEVERFSCDSSRSSRVG